MNITTQLCSLALLCIIGYFYYKNRRLHLQTELAFERMVYLTIFYIVWDIISILVVSNYIPISSANLHVSCKSFLASMICVAESGLLYVRSNFFLSKEKFKGMSKFADMTALIGVILVYVLPIQHAFGESARISYSSGPSVTITYIFVVAYIIASLSIVLTQNQQIIPLRRTAVFIWQSLWLITVTFAYFRNEFLSAGYFCVLGIVIVSLILEDPSGNIIRDTGLFNQNGLKQSLKQRYQDDKPFVMLVIILKQAFKNYDNEDTHTESQEVILQELAKYFLSLPGVLAFQNSEDEIMILFEDNAKGQQAWSLLEKRFEYGWTIGSSLIMPDWLYIPDCTIVKELNELLYLIRYARTNMKELSESNFLLIDNMFLEKIQEQKRVSQILSDAMNENRVEVFFQPIYSCTEKKFTSAEALVRIRNKDGSYIPPGIFIPVAEQTGKIIYLGRIIFEQVCEFITKNDLRKYGIHYIEINLSTVQCSHDYLAADFIRIMNSYKIDPSMINLEITETASLSEKRKLLNNMKLLMDYGAHFSLDDFGTGQSNLNYIIDMPVNIVKFDRELSNAYFNSGKAKYVMDAAIQMIHGMKLEIVSEGIETAEQYKIMEDLGINYIQGYYFSKPLPKNEFLEFIKEQNMVA